MSFNTRKTQQNSSYMGHYFYKNPLSNKKKEEINKNPIYDQINYGLNDLQE